MSEVIRPELQIRAVPVADLLPALLVAPLLTALVTAAS